MKRLTKKQRQRQIRERVLCTAAIVLMNLVWIILFAQTFYANYIDTGQQGYYDVPLSSELQEYIFKECQKENISPAVIVAIIGRESGYDPQAVGDGGDSQGLMQIQKKWHEDLMTELGCEDLLDPYQNVKVGIAIVADLKERNRDLQWVLMAYNGGIAYADRLWSKGTCSEYAAEVSERISALERS